MRARVYRFELIVYVCVLGGGDRKVFDESALMNVMSQIDRYERSNRQSIIDATPTSNSIHVCRKVSIDSHTCIHSTGHPTRRSACWRFIKDNRQIITTRYTNDNMHSIFQSIHPSHTSSPANQTLLRTRRGSMSHAHLISPFDKVRWTRK